jgi:phosphopantetheinyl transferase (holo-ACP synthase)
MLNIRVVRLWTDYLKNADGTLRAVDKVEYCAPGMAQKSTTVATIKSLSAIRKDADLDNIAAAMAADRWAAIEPHYKAWKDGQEAPEHGTPLAAWPGVTLQQAEVLKQTGLRSVEEVAAAVDSVISRVQLPNMRDIQANAKRFLEAQDTQKFSAEMMKRDAENAVLREQLEELRQIVIAQQADASEDLNADGTEKKRRGRPPNKPEGIAA